MPFSRLWASADNSVAPEEALRRAQQTRRALASRATAHGVRAAVIQNTVAESTDSTASAETQSWVSSLQQNFLTKNLYGLSKDNDAKKEQAERARCVFSLIKLLVKTIGSLFEPCPSRGQPVHVINTVIADDADTRLKGMGQDNRTVLRTICDTVQSVHIRYEKTIESMMVPTPMLVLAAPKTADIHAAATAHSLVCGAGVGRLLKSYGVPESVVQTGHAGWRTTIQIGDALKANMAAWRIERAHLQSQRVHSDARLLGLNFKCLVHTLNLIRKPMVLPIPGFWSTLVRFAHLMESYSFRTGFTAALLRVLQSPNVFQRIWPMLFTVNVL